MARFKGVELPNNKIIKVALTYIYGVGETRALEALNNANVDCFKKVSDLTEDEIAAIRKELDNLVLEGDLRRKTKEDIKLKIEINSYQGNRHRKKLPVRGQNTRNNARTARGGKRSVVANKKK